MSARSDLGALIGLTAPDTWEIYDYPLRLSTFEDPAKPVAIVIEQRGITAGNFSPDGVKMPLEVELVAWVVVDGTRGQSSAATEDLLEAAAEQMIRILAPLPEHVWDGTSARGAYDEQKPAYQFTIRAAGALTTEE